MKQLVTLILSLFFSTLVYSQSVPSYVPTNGLVGWWGFNGNAQDASGNGNHGTINNGVTFTSDRHQGSNAAFQVLLNWQYCSSPNGFGITLPVNLLNTEYSISVWCQSFDSLAHNQTIFNSSPHNFFGVGYNHGVTNPRNTIISFFGNNNGWILTNNNITWTSSLLQNWKHIVLVKSLGEIKFFENGQMVFSHLLPPISNPLGIDSIRFGAVTVNSVTIQSGCYEPFLGKIDDAGIWNRTLTQQEITNLYNAQLSTQTSLCLPTLTTNSPISIGIDSVIVGGNILNDGGSSIVLRGVCYSTTPNPNMGNMRTEDGSGVGSFTSILRNLSPTITYYARSYAKNSNGVAVYGNEVTFTTLPLLGQPCPGTPTVSDIDGNVYNTVQIGNQCWMQSNLRTSKYRNGDTINSGLNNNDWNAATTGAYSQQNLPGSLEYYGNLYNHYAVSDNRGLCPTGWRVPTIQEWFVLADFLGGQQIAGGKLKQALTQPQAFGWDAPNVGATNESGYSAYGAGFRDIIGHYSLANVGTFFWSSSIYQGRINASYAMSLFYSDAIFSLYDYTTYSENRNGFSVRCLRDSSAGGGGSASLPSVTTVAISGLTSSGASTGGNVTFDGGSAVTSRGVAYGLSTNPTTSGTITIDGSGMGSFVSTLTGLTASTTYYVRAYAINGVGTAYGNEVTFTTMPLLGQPCPGAPTVTDIDGNIYNTVKIGNQCWTQSNLKVSRYRNGDTIPTGLSDAQWGSTTSGSYSIYGNIPGNDSTYGKLYNHFSVMDSRGLCPTGWHIPTDSEWNLMVKYLDPNADTLCPNCTQTYTVGGILKSLTTQPTPGGWNFPNSGATNSSGFTAEPGGLRSANGLFFNLGIDGFWWSSSPSGSYAWFRLLAWHNSAIYRNYYTQEHGFAVRCLRDSLVGGGGSASVPSLTTLAISGVTSTGASTGGDVTSDGGSAVTSRGVAYGLTSNPTTSGTITTDGSGVGSFVSTLSGLTASTTYYVRAYATNGVGTAYGNEIIFSTNTSNGFSSCGGVIDVDGNTYQTVQIGTQCWTQSNFTVSKYRNGDNIPNITDNTQWSQTNTSSTGAWCNYNNDANNGTTYGKLYNWYAVNDIRGLCPTGWHVPTDSEWNLMVKYLDPNADTTCVGCLPYTNAAGTVLKSPSGWASNGNGTNLSGFTALPGGGRFNDGDFGNLGSNIYVFWWSSSVMGLGNAWCRYLNYYDAYIDRLNYDHRRGFYIRCVRD